MPRIVLTGAPGAGKTTLLAELAARGHRTVPESARAIIAERLARGESPRPGPLEFAREMLRRDIEKFRANTGSDGLTFFDRSALESVAMLHEASPLAPEELQARVSELEFHPSVFVLPPWEAIYTTDAERDQTFEHALRVHESICRWYRSLGYTLVAVPPGPVATRAHFVLDHLEKGDAWPARNA